MSKVTPQPKIGFVSLGCPKNLVDSERILTELRTEGYDVVPSYDDADMVIVNTCGFIDSAVQESLEAIGEALNENGKVIVTGCLGAKEDQIREVHPKVLEITGPHSYEQVLEHVHHYVPKPKHNPFLSLVPEQGVKLTPRHYAYLKISEGCNHRCTFCIIPSMRGDLVSRPIGEVLAEAGAAMTEELLMALPVKKLADLFQSKEVNENVGELLVQYDHQIEYIKSIYDSKREKVTEGDDLPPGVIKMVKVHIAIKRKLSVGDKMAGRHGNKGVVSRILPEEDMPFFADGRPVDIVLNPLGVPSRMNIGQIMETHLGWGAKELGRQLAELVDSGKAMQVVRDEVKDVFNSPEISKAVDEMDDEEFAASVRKLRKGITTRTPVFDGATEDEIWSWMDKAHLSNDGKSVLYDGRTGVPFKNRVTVGVMYMLKLHHLVDEKIHARSTGPYSLVTQQPLGGKAQFGGQRFGEMEVWALEAYGASYLLQEFLTVKSDDVTGRVKMYEKIVKGDNFLEAGMPESFNVLVKELMSLGLNVTLQQDESKPHNRRLGFIPGRSAGTAPSSAEPAQEDE